MPFQFIPPGAQLERGPEDRLQRTTIVVDDPPLSHERCSLLTVHPEIQDRHKSLVLEEVVRIMREDFELVIPDSFVYPIGVGMVAFEDVLLRDH